MRYYLTLTRMTRIHNNSKETTQLELSYTAIRVKDVTIILEKRMAFSHKYILNPSNYTPKYLSKKSKILYRTQRIGKKNFTAGIFMIAKIWK